MTFLSNAFILSFFIHLFEFLSEAESKVLVGDELRKIAIQAEAKGKYYFIKLITEEMAIIGIAIPFLVGTKINVKCVWQTLENESRELQNKIINKHLPLITKKGVQPTYVQNRT